MSRSDFSLKQTQLPFRWVCLLALALAAFVGFGSVPVNLLAQESQAAHESQTTSANQNPHAKSSLHGSAVEQIRSNRASVQESPNSQNQNDDPNDPFGDPFDDDPFGDDPFGDDPFGPGGDPAAGAAGCMVCGVCGAYGAIIGFSILMGVIGIALQIWMMIYVYNDATRNNVDNAALWVLLVFFLGVLGLLIYLLAGRNNRTPGPPHHGPHGGPHQGKPMY